MNRIFFHIAFLLPFLVTTNIKGQQIHARLDNQFSTWGTVSFQDPVAYQLGGRYIPTLNVYDSLKKNRILDTELSLNTFGNALFSGDHYEDGDIVLKPYRLWVRYASPQFELRIGLQKINFGSASIFRPLMWFDRIDYRDPLQLTNGVYGVLGRYYFMENANIWLWALYGNTDARGWDRVPTKKHTPEFGGRIQLPIGKGEGAVSYHSRQAQWIPPNDTFPVTGPAPYNENRIGVDGKWDLGVGIWFENTIKYNNMDHLLIPHWETFFNLGMDYTFSIGGGLNMTAEYFRYGRKDELAGSGKFVNYTAIAANYPLGILNTITAMVYYDWDQNNLYRFINLQRRYDFWSFYLMAYWNPDVIAIYNEGGESSLFGGKGIQIMAVVNF